MIPIFTSHFSIGKSILTLQHPDKETSDGSDSIFSIAKESGLKNLFLVEESMTGFFEAFRISKELGIQLHFGYKFVCCNSDANAKSNHKLIAFAKNDAGCTDGAVKHISVNADFSLEALDLLRCKQNEAKTQIQTTLTIKRLLVQLNCLNLKTLVLHLYIYL
jgi:hypothetical protein